MSEQEFDYQDEEKEKYYTGNDRDNYQQNDNYQEQYQQYGQQFEQEFEQNTNTNTNTNTDDYQDNDLQGLSQTRQREYSNTSNRSRRSINRRFSNRRLSSRRNTHVDDSPNTNISNTSNNINQPRKMTPSMNEQDFLAQLPPHIAELFNLMKNTIEEQDQNIAELEEENEQVKKALNNSKREHLSEKDSLEMQIREMSYQMDVYKNENINFKSDNEALVSQIKLLNSNTSRMDMSNSQLQEAQFIADRATKEVDRLNDIIKKQKEHLNTMKEQTTKAQRTIMTLTKSLNAKNEEMKKLENDFDLEMVEAEQIIEEYERRVELLQNENGELLQQVEQTQKENYKMQEDIINTGIEMLTDEVNNDEDDVIRFDKPQRRTRTSIQITSSGGNNTSKIKDRFKKHKEQLSTVSINDPGSLFETMRHSRNDSTSSMLSDVDEFKQRRRSSRKRSGGSDFFRNLTETSSSIMADRMQKLLKQFVDNELTEKLKYVLQEELSNQNTDELSQQLEKLISENKSGIDENSMNKLLTQFEITLNSTLENNLRGLSGNNNSNNNSSDNNNDGNELSQNNIEKILNEFQKKNERK